LFEAKRHLYILDAMSEGGPAGSVLSAALEAEMVKLYSRQNGARNSNFHETYVLTLTDSGEVLQQRPIPQVDNMRAPPCRTRSLEVQTVQTHRPPRKNSDTHYPPHRYAIRSSRF
jgi:hypothetical protein